MDVKNADGRRDGSLEGVVYGAVTPGRTPGDFDHRLLDYSDFWNGMMRKSAPDSSRLSIPWFF
jgi:hypothetical protein